MTSPVFRQEVALRPCLDSDMPFLQTLYGEMAASLLSTLALGGKTLEEALPGLMHGVPGLCVILSDHLVPVGIISGEQRTTAGGSVLWIRLLLIAQAYRRHGYGEAAIGQLLRSESPGASFHRVLLAVEEQNVGARAFWGEMGFVPLHHLPPRGNPHSSVLILSRECATP